MSHGITGTLIQLVPPVTDRHLPLTPCFFILYLHLSFLLSYLFCPVIGQRSFYYGPTRGTCIHSVQEVYPSAIFHPEIIIYSSIDLEILSNHFQHLLSVTITYLITYLIKTVDSQEGIPLLFLVFY